MKTICKEYKANVRLSEEETATSEIVMQMCKGMNLPLKTPTSTTGKDTGYSKVSPVCLVIGTSCET